MKKQEVVLTNIQIIAALDGLAALRQKELPVGIGFSLVGNLKTIRGRIETYNEYRMDLLKKYAKLDDHGQPTVRESGFVEFESKEAEAAAAADIVALNNATVTDNFTLYTWQEFMTAGVTIAPVILECLDWMIREEL